MQNKNFKTILLTVLGAFSSFASVNAAEVNKMVSAINKDSSKEGRKEGRKKESEPSTLKKTEQNSVSSSNNSFKKHSSDIMKVTSGVLGGTVFGFSIKYLYDNYIANDPKKLLQDWNKRNILDMAATTWNHSKFKGKDKQPINVEDDCCILSDRYREENLFFKPEVMNIYNGLYELYTELLNRNEVKNLHFRKDIGGDDEIRCREYYVSESFKDFLGYSDSTGKNDELWKIRNSPKYNTSDPVVSCDMPDTTGDQTYQYRARIFGHFADENSDQETKLMYLVTFKKLNGKLTFEKLEFPNGVENDND